MKALPFALAYTMPLLVIGTSFLGGPWLLATPVVVFVLLPIMDGLGGENWNEPTSNVGRERFDRALRGWLPMQLLMLALVALRIQTGTFSLAELMAVSIATGVVTGGSGITIAHELMHRRSKSDRALAEALMLLTLYPWFCVEHVQGHHKTVSTPEDPAFSPRGRTLYAYLPQTLIGGLRSAWRIETRRVTKRKIRGLADRRLRMPLALALLLGAIAVVAGPTVLAWFVGQALMAVFLLETINYVEHYGLERRKTPSGGYERVQAAHSWNTPARLTNWYLFNLQRHADHHAFAARPYEQLRNLPGSPTLPAGYPTMMVIALIPTLWFSILHPILDGRRQASPPQAGVLAK